MRINYLIIVIVLVVLNFVVAGKTENSGGTIMGKIIDRASGQPLVSANVIINHTTFGTASGYDGEFVIGGISPGEYILYVSLVGYERFRQEIVLDEVNDTLFLDVKLNISPYKLDGCIVSSPRHIKNIEDVAMPMEVVTSRDIKSEALATVSDYMDAQPGITLQRDGIWASSVSIRGLSKNNIVTLVDGSRIETSANLAAALSMVDVNDIERIEVIKGAGSVLYGSGATGGIVNIITDSPGFSNAFRIKGAFTGNYNSVNNGSAGYLNINASSEKWFVKLNSSLRNADNAITGNGDEINSHFRDNYFAFKAGMKPYENQKFVLDYQRFYAEDIGIPGGAPFPDAASARYPMQKRELYNVSYELTDMFQLPMKLSVKYFHQVINREVEIIPNPFAVSKPSATHTSDGVQLQVDYVLNKNNLLIAGFDMWQREYIGWRRVTNNKLLKEVVDKPLPDATFKSTGLFLQDEINAIENKLDITLGGRIDLIDVENKSLYSPYSVTDLTTGQTVYPQNNLLWESRSADDISWSLNLSGLYRLNKKIDLTINVAKSFRSPALEERYQYIQLGGATYLGDPDLEPENGWFFDAGLRLKQENYLFRINGFINSLENLVIDKAMNDTTYIKDNVGEAILYGSEFQLNYRVSSNIMFDLSASYVRGKDTRADENLPQITPINGRVGIRYNYNKALSVNLSSVFFGAQKDVAPGEKETLGSILLNFSLQYTDISLGFITLDFYAGVENMLDKSYRNHLSTYRGIVQQEPGRNFYVKTSINF